MDSRVKLYIERAKSELILSKVIFKISKENKIKRMLRIESSMTFYSNCISNAYYSIFYSSKAFLLTKDIRTEPPEEHKKTFEEFEKFVNSGTINFGLLKIYKSMIVKADELLGISQKEKSKRGKFNYSKLPQSNMEPAKESIQNAEKFLKNITLLTQ